MSIGYAPVRKLAATDQTDAFDCGQTALNQFLQRYALVNQKASSAQTLFAAKVTRWSGFTASLLAASIRNLLPPES